MLFVLTGEIQIGKTRWLDALVDTLDANGVTCCGVLAPGVWRARDIEEENAAAGAVGMEYAWEDAASAPKNLEKLGIDNVLLPGRKRIAFARRADLALQEGTYDAESQSARAHLKWEISDVALAQVNRYFSALCTDVAAGSRAQLLVVDELGQLELLLGGGLASAVALLDGGPTARFPHALAVVRTDLARYAVDRYAQRWGGARMIGPDNEGEHLVLSALVPAKH